jgi:nucleoside-diphosphate-sugar epimerase
MREMSITVALTGTTGAMGGEVLQKLMLSQQDIKVRCILFEGESKIPSFVKKTLKTYKERIFAFRGDIARYSDCEKLIDGADYVINCASLIPPKSDHDPDGTYLSNFLGTKNIVDAIISSARADTIKYVHIATVAMYGNRTYPHVWGRVGDPIISSDYDVYSLYKLKAERYVLDSGIKNFVSLRQTGILHKYMFANNLKDGLMFHTAWNTPLEWVTDVDSGILIKNLVERDTQNKLEGFWNRIYNIGGGIECRITGFETIDGGFALMGKGAKAFFKPNWNISRNFHGVWFYDSDELNDFLDFRTQNIDDYWRVMGKKYWYFKLGAVVPSPIISKLFIQRLFKNTNSPRYWIDHNKEGRIKAFFGGRENYEKIATDWKKFPLLCEGKAGEKDVDYDKLRDNESGKNYLLSHGYDEEKGLLNLDYSDLNNAAKFRGGECLTPDYAAGNVYKKVKWKCEKGHEFLSSPYTILKGGYWCPHCAEPKPWKYGSLAHIPFYGQVYFDTHTTDEENDVFPLFDGEDDFIKN